LTLNADGSYTYTPDANYNGADSFTWQANDAAYPGDPTALDSNVASFNLSITPVNDALQDTKLLI
jgi:large repetitive protein